MSSENFLLYCKSSSQYYSNIFHILYIVNHLRNITPTSFISLRLFSRNGITSNFYCCISSAPSICPSLLNTSLFLSRSLLYSFSLSYSFSSYILSVMMYTSGSSVLASVSVLIMVYEYQCFLGDLKSITNQEESHIPDTSSLRLDLLINPLYLFQLGKTFGRRPYLIGFP